MKTCNKCGANIQDDVLFCPQCGSALKENDRFCPFCGQKLTGSEAYCSHCGRNLNESTSKNISNPYSIYAIIFMICSLLLQELILPILAIVYGKKGVNWCKSQDEKYYKNSDGYTVCKAAYIIGISKIAIVLGGIIIILLLVLAAYLNGTIDSLLESIKDLLESIQGLLG